MHGPEAEFPALMIHSDNSVGILNSLDYWTHDVDQWFYSEPGDYLIDSLGRRFIQSPERSKGSSPSEIPTWVYDSDVDEATLLALVSSAIGSSSDVISQDLPDDPEQRIRSLINLVIEDEERLDNYHRYLEAPERYRLCLKAILFRELAIFLVVAPVCLALVYPTVGLPIKDLQWFHYVILCSVLLLYLMLMNWAYSKVKVAQLKKYGLLCAECAPLKSLYRNRYNLRRGECPKCLKEFTKKIDRHKNWIISV